MSEAYFEQTKEVTMNAIYSPAAHLINISPSIRWRNMEFRPRLGSCLPPRPAGVDFRYRDGHYAQMWAQGVDADEVRVALETGVVADATIAAMDRIIAANPDERQWDSDGAGYTGA